MKFRAAVAASIFAAFLSSLAAEAEPPPTVQKLAEGVWAAQPEKGANVGWFLLGDSVVAVDAGSDAATAREILKQIAETAGKPVRYLILTHAHADHVGGAKVFADTGAQVVAQENAAPTIMYVLAPQGAPAKSAILTVSDRVMFVGGARRAEIYWLGPAHTKGDLIVLLPREKVLFSGDLAANGRLPFLTEDADPRGWEQALPRVAAAPVEKMVPGHGEIGPTAGVGDALAYLRRVNDLAKKFIETRVPVDFYHIELRKPENRIENVPLTEEHIANVKVAVKLETERLTKPTPSPAAKPARTPTAKAG